ncbi:nitrous oxide reductase family maturation protein NosD [Rapidithrix thailandica]|uniref:Nitrous oxide reductase family maturation protein NosD n=1 Tax=Rapidithrix thailandica TaxID=413964 RepID=A0AAW9S3D1_9BACT
MANQRTLLIIGLLLSNLLSFAQAGTRTICKTCPVNSIRQGIQQARAGDTLRVKPGSYTEGNLTIDKPLTLIGENYPVIEGAHQKQEIISVKSDHVTIKGFRIQNMAPSYTEDIAGIKVYKFEYCLLENNELHNTFFGIYLNNTSKSIVRNNKVIGNAENEMSSANAIHLWYCKNITIENNLTQNHRDGIYLEFVENSSVTGNTSKGNLRYGLHFMFSNHNAYTNNTFTDNGAGVAVMFSRYITMKNNLFLKNWGSSSYGLLLKEIYDGEISGNIFKENTIGIYAEGSNRLQVSHNNFEQNGWALKILGSCMDNVFASNNFLSNTFDLSTNPNATNYNDYTGNYWSEYTGYDLDKDGIGDVPYRPVKVFSYMVARVPESIILLRSLFIDFLNFAEKVTPVLTPDTLKDEAPKMKPLPR